MDVLDMWKEHRTDVSVFTLFAVMWQVSRIGKRLKRHGLRLKRVEHALGITPDPQELTNPGIERRHTNGSGSY